MHFFRTSKLPLLLEWRSPTPIGHALLGPLLCGCLMLMALPASTQTASDGLVNPVRSMTLPPPTASNTVADAKHLDKKCYESALRKAWKAAQAGLPKVESTMLNDLMRLLGDATNGMDPAGRAATLTALTSTTDRGAFIAALPEDLSEQQVNALRDFRTTMDDAWLYSTTRSIPCAPSQRLAMVGNNPNDAQAAAGYHLHGQVTYSCDCSPEGGNIKAYAIDYVVPVSLFYGGEDVGTGMAMIPETANTIYYVKKLSCCKKDKDEEDEEPASAMTPEEADALGEALVGGTSNLITGDPRINGGDDCMGNAPFDGPIVSGFGGYEAHNFSGSGTQSFSCGGLRVGMPVLNSAVAGLSYTYDVERDAFNDFTTRTHYNHFDAFFDWFFGCGGPIQPYAGIQGGYIRGRYVDRYTGIPGFETENIDGISGWRVGAYYGAQANLCGGPLSAGVKIPLVEYRSITYQPEDPFFEGFEENSFFHSLNLKAPSFMLTYDLNAGSAGERTRYYNPRLKGFDPTANDGLVGTANFGYWHWFSDGYSESRVRLGGGALYPVLDDFLVGANVNLGLDRSKSTFDFGFGETTSTNRNLQIGLEAMLQAYPFDVSGPVEPMFGVNVNAGVALDRFVDDMGMSTTGTDFAFGAGINAGLYFDVADNWGLLGTFPLVGYSNTSNGVVNYGFNKPVAGLQVLYALCGGGLDREL